MAQFDPVHLTDLVAEESRLRSAVGELAIKLNDTYATDKQWDESRQARYLMDQQRHAQLTRELQMVRSERQAYELRAPERARRSDRSALVRFLRSGSNGLDAAEQKELLDEGTVKVDMATGPAFMLGRTLEGAADDDYVRSDDSSGAGVTQPTTEPRVVDRLRHFGGVAQMAQEFRTATGSEWRIPQEDSADQEGEVLEEQSDNTDPLAPGDLAPIVFRSRTISSRIIPLTRELLQDAVFDVQAYFERRLVRRIGRISDNRFTTTPQGLGQTTLQGVLTQAADGVTAASQTILTYPELAELIHAVDYAYRDEMGEGGGGGLMPEGGGRIGWLVADAAVKALRVMVDGDSRPLWVPSVREGVPDMIAGYPFSVGGHMPAPAAGKSPMLFGNFSYFGIRTASQLEVFRITDGTTLSRNSIWCLAFARRDSRCLGAVVNNRCEAIKRLTMAA